MSHADYMSLGLTLEAAKEQARAELEVWYGGAAQDVFDSSALGVPCRYWCGPENIAKVNTLTIAKRDGSLMCGVIPATGSQDPDYKLTPHTARQAAIVQQDYATFVGRIDDKRLAMLAQIATLSSVQVVQDYVNTTLENVTL